MNWTARLVLAVVLTGGAPLGLVVAVPVIPDDVATTTLGWTLTAAIVAGIAVAAYASRFLVSEAQCSMTLRVLAGIVGLAAGAACGRGAEAMGFDGDALSRRPMSEFAMLDEAVVYGSTVVGTVTAAFLMLGAAQRRRGGAEHSACEAAERPDEADRAG